MGLLRKWKMWAAFLAVLGLMAPPVIDVSAATAKEWWEKDYWEEEKLLELGAELPTYDAATDRYEISTPGQLLYLSGIWKTEDSNGDGVPDAPCNGYYVLTADIDMKDMMGSIGSALTKASGVKTSGYMPPIATETDQQEAGGVKCAFFGTFDGQGHTIRNITIRRMSDKYAGFFGNVGHDFGVGFVKNLALVDIRVECVASCGLLAGGLYGEVDNCVVIGTIDCLQKTAGGLAGKIKKNDNGSLGTARNCFIYADIVVHGQGNENGAAGGVTSAQSDGGMIYNCYVGGSITVEGIRAESVAGVSGNLKAGQALENTVMLLSKIDVANGTNNGLLCGDYSGENGSHLANNYVWEGTAFRGFVSSEHPSVPAYGDATAGQILSKAFYTDTLGWDFADIWGWVENDAHTAGYPMPEPFASEKIAGAGFADRIAGDLVVKGVVLRPSEPMTTTGFEGEPVVVGATLTLPEGFKDAKEGDGLTLYYGTEKDGSGFAKSAGMERIGDAGARAATEPTLGSDDGAGVGATGGGGLAGDAGIGGVYAVTFPEDGAGTYYYYLEAIVGGERVTFPNDISACVTLKVESVASKLTPQHVTVSPGLSYDKVGFNWITAEGGLTARVLYRKEGEAPWLEAPVAQIEDCDVGGRGAFTSYSVDVEGLSPGAVYEYQPVTEKGGVEYPAQIATFTTLTDGESFRFIACADLQSTTEEGYLPFLYTMENFVADELGGTDFVVHLGDLTENCSVSEWNYMFNVLGGYYANSLNAFVAGNHECKGDLLYTIFKGQTNQPGGLDDDAIGETTGNFVVGDACFVIINSDPYSGKEGADTAADKVAYYEKQKEWAKQVFEESGCRWRIVAAHAGLIQDDPVATEFLEKMCDELYVDLYLNGHIHDYYRATVKGGEKAATGVGTTFITTSPMGRKFDDFRPGTIDDLLDFQTGGEADKRQYFTEVALGPDGMEIATYRLAVAGDDTNKKTFKAFDVIDTVSLSMSLSEAAGAWVKGGAAGGGQLGGAEGGTAAGQAGGAGSADGSGAVVGNESPANAANTSGGAGADVAAGAGQTAPPSQFATDGAVTGYPVLWGIVFAALAVAGGGAYVVWYRKKKA
ncbi:MAG: metallophosphoesterase family protein [Lachnospiraceae bacterium]|jgi:hypothetical protein|nr:metallophosphoesterase family protein [Lachnospiraceae bacterium]